MPRVRNDRPLCTLTLTQLPAAYSMPLNGLSCQLDSPSEIFNIQPEVYQATVCQMVSEGLASVLLQLSLSLCSFSHLRYGHALYDSLRSFHFYINNTLRRRIQIHSLNFKTNIMFYSLNVLHMCGREIQTAPTPWFRHGTNMHLLCSTLLNWHLIESHFPPLCK